MGAELKTRGKRSVAIVLIAVVAAVLCVACAQQPPREGDTGQEMVRSADETSGGEIAIATTNEDGSCTVVIGEANIMTDEQFAKDSPEVVSAEEASGFETEASVDDEMSRADIEQEDANEADSAADEQVSDGSSEVALAEEPDKDESPDTILVEESDAEEGESSKVTPAEEPEQAKTESVEDGEWSLADVRQEDVVICYHEVSSGEDGMVSDQIREAKVVGFANNGDSIELSFADPSGDGLTSDIYTVRFVNTDRYTVVAILQAANDFEVTAVDYEGQIAEELQNVDIGFTTEDVALPEGTYIEEGQLVVTEDAPDVVQEVLVESGIAESELSRDIEERPDDDKVKKANDDGNAGSSSGASSDDKDAAVEYMKEVNARQKKFRNYDAAADYTVEVLDYVDPTYGKVAQFGSDAYSVFKGVYSGDVGSVLKGGMGILKMFGLFKKKSASTVPTVSNEQILSEVQKVGIEVVNVHELVAAMNDTVNITRQELYSQGVEAYDNALIALEGDAEILQNMLTQGAIAAAREGIEPPEEDCTAEDEFEYNWQLVNYINEQEQKKDRKSQKFAGFTRYAEDLGSNFTLVAGATAKPTNTNPITKYDKYWNTYFNYETQGYYLRQAYRSNIEYQLKRAFGILEIYHNIFDPEAGGVKLSYNNQFCSALESLEQMPAGQSPQEIDVYKPFRVYCPTLDCDVFQISVQRFAKGNNVVYEVLQEYANRLHGRTIEEDFKLAGLWGDGHDPGSRDQLLQWYNPPWEELGPTDYSRRYYREENYSRGGHGIGFNCKDKDSGHYVADIIGYEGGVYKEQPTFNCNTWESFKPYDLPKEGGPDSVSQLKYIFLGLRAHDA